MATDMPSEGDERWDRPGVQQYWSLPPEDECYRSAAMAVRAALVGGQLDSGDSPGDVIDAAIKPALDALRTAGWTVEPPAT